MNAGHQIAGVVLPGPPFGPPIVSPPVTPAIQLPVADQSISSIDSLSSRARAPILAVGDLQHLAVLAKIKNLKPDLIVVACFPSLLPPVLLQIPRLGGVNVHPSLLPRGRGPDPLFWTFRRGEPETGVTVHLLDDQFDSGPILLQEHIPVPEGIRLPNLELQLAELGANTLVEAIDQLIDGTARPIPQSEPEATTAPVPCEADYEVPTDLPARWAFNFVRAIAPATNRLKVVVMATKEEIAIADAVSFNEAETPENPVSYREGLVNIGFRVGSVTFVLPQLD